MTHLADGPAYPTSTKISGPIIGKIGETKQPMQEIDDAAKRIRSNAGKGNATAPSPYWIPIAADADTILTAKLQLDTIHTDTVTLGNNLQKQEDAATAADKEALKTALKDRDDARKEAASLKAHELTWWHIFFRLAVGGCVLVAAFEFWKGQIMGGIVCAGGACIALAIDVNLEAIVFYSWIAALVLAGGSVAYLAWRYHATATTADAHVAAAGNIFTHLENQGKSAVTIGMEDLTALVPGFWEKIQKLKAKGEIDKPEDLKPQPAAIAADVAKGGTP